MRKNEFWILLGKKLSGEANENELKKIADLMSGDAELENISKLMSGIWQHSGTAVMPDNNKLFDEINKKAQNGKMED